MKNYLEDKQKLVKMFSRRTIITFIIQLILGTILLGRLFYLQILSSRKYKKLSDDNMSNFYIIPPLRGEFFDRNNKKIATNKKSYIATITLEDSGSNLSLTLNNFSRIVPITASKKSHVKRMIEQNKAYIPIVIKENLTWTEVEKLKTMITKLPGVKVEQSSQRYYKYGSILASVTGYIKSPSINDIKNNDSELLYKVSNFKIGAQGIERSYNKQLEGKSGYSRVKINAYGHLVKELENHPAQAGSNLFLTIDADLQSYIYNLMLPHSGSVCVLDCHTGAILSMVSSPSYNPNDFSSHLSQAQVNEYFINPFSPMQNKAINGLYAPGSTFKPIVALAALQNKAIIPQTKFFCSGKFKIGNRYFSCWKSTGHGILNLQQAIMNSCDIYFYQAAMASGIDNIYNMASKFNLGQKTGIDLLNESSGLVPNREWKQTHFKQSWQIGETAISGIGQGYITTTPLQLAVMTAQIANNGYKIIPYLVDKIITSDKKAHIVHKQNKKSLGINRKHLKVVQQGMYDVVNKPHGTAYFYSHIKDPLWQLAGKSGTAQVRNISSTERSSGVVKNEQLEWNMRDHALFIAYAPYTKPRYAISIAISHGGGGSKIASPIAKNIVLYLKNTENRKQLLT